MFEVDSCNLYIDILWGRLPGSVAQDSNTTIYTARQLYGIALLMPPLCLTAGGNLWQYHHKALGIHKRPLVTPLTNFMVDHHLCAIPVSLLPRECWYPQLPQRQCGTFAWITFSCEPSLYANGHLKPKRQSCQPISSLQLLRCCSVLMSWVFSEGDVENYWSATRCHLKSPAPHLWAVVLSKGSVGIYWRRLHQKKTLSFSVSSGERVSSQHSGSGWNAVSLSTRPYDVE